MNKHRNPFVPNPPFTHPQPPLPPGPAPTPGQPAPQQDFSAYWTQRQPVSAAPATYNPQWPAANGGWTAPQPAQQAKPVPPQPGLYANYGYGPQQNLQWQQHGQAQSHHQVHYAQPAVPTAHPPTAPQFHPYAAQAVVAAYPQPYTPHPIPTQPAAHPQFHPGQPGQPFLPPQGPRPTHPHPSPQHVPPAKRQRFDHGNPPQPRLQPPPPPPLPPTGPNENRATGPAGQSNQPGIGANRGGAMGGRGNMARGGRGGSMNMGRGGNSNRSGRGGSMNTGGGRNAPMAGPLRGHGSRDRGGFNRRGGGSFGPQASAGNSSFRSHGRNGPGHGKGARSENQNKSANTTSGGNKKDENKRTLTDFKLVGLEIQNLDWRWGMVPHLLLLPDEVEHVAETGTATEAPSVDGTKAQETDMDTSVANQDYEPSTSTKKDATTDSTEVPSPSPSRLRIYFHTPPSSDDLHPIAQAASSSDVRKGKRKKSEDDDADTEEPRAPPPPPVPQNIANIDGDERGCESVAPSVTETLSEEAGLDLLLGSIAESDDTLHEAKFVVSSDLHGDGAADEDETMLEVATQQDEPIVPDDGFDEGNQQTNEPAVSNSQITNPDVEQPESTNEGDMETKQPTESSIDDVEHLEVTGTDSETGAERAKDDVATDLNTEAKADDQQQPGDGLLGAVESPVFIMPPHSHEEEENKQGVIETEEGDRDAQHASHGDAGESPLSHHGDNEDDFEIPGLGMDNDYEHLPEPPMSPVSVTLPSSSSTTVSTHQDGYAPPSKVLPADKLASANRVSISYAAGSRRLVIDAEIVEKLSVHRAEGRIEVSMTVERSTDGFKGILIEALDETTKSYTPLQDLSEASESDETLPPFWCFVIPTKTVLVAYLDTERPLSEPKWVKTGDVQDWLKTLLGRMFWVAGDAIGWEKKIEVVDPDPAPTIQNVMDSWASYSTSGSLSDRQRFIKTHLAESDNVLEILLRLVRGERATAFAQGSSAISATTLSGPLLSAYNAAPDHATQQTHVSLAVLSIAKLAVEYAQKAAGDEKGKAEAEERIGEVVRCLPSHLVQKSLDGMFKEWKADKKGSGRRS